MWFQLGKYIFIVIFALASIFLQALVYTSIGQMIYWNQWGERKSISLKRTQILYRVNHARLIQDGRYLLEKYPNGLGAYDVEFNVHNPLYLQSLEPTHLAVIPNKSVALNFGRHSELFIADENATGPPQIIADKPWRELYPGLWYIEYE